MASSVAFKLVLVVLGCMVVGAPLAQAVIPCSRVSQSVGPCISYLKKGGAVPVPCCNGIRSLIALAGTTPDRQAVCRCLVATAKSVTGIKGDLVSGLPGACKVRLPYPIGPNVDCNRKMFSWIFSIKL
ncbi:hypothetical protein ACE6H2_021901 [Prunus campanulata]